MFDVLDLSWFSLQITNLSVLTSIKIVTNIASANCSESAKLHAQSIKLKQAAKIALDQKDIVHAQAQASQTKVSSTMLLQKNTFIRELKR